MVRTIAIVLPMVLAPVAAMAVSSGWTDLTVRQADRQVQQTRDGGGAVPAGTAVIAGRVVGGDQAASPIRRAIVTVAGGSPHVSRSAITDDDGRFAIGSLPAGRMTIAVVKRGFVPGAYGAQRPGRPGTPVQLTAGQTLDTSIRLFRAGVVTGRLTDEHGDPMPGARVFAIEARRPAPPEPTGSNPGVLTDDRGVFRIFDLAPGEYLIVATATASVMGDLTRRSAAQTDAVLAGLQARASGRTMSAAAPAAALALATLAPVFFPGTPVMAGATRVAVGAGDVRDGLDFSMPIVPVTTIEGTVVSGEGPLPASLEMSILPASALRFFALGGANPQLVTPPGPDGRFKYTGIVPGRYTIIVRANRAAPAATGRGGGGAGGATPAPATGRGPSGRAIDTMYALESFDVSGQPVSGLTLRLERGSRVSGRVMFDAAAQPAPADLTAIRMTLLPGLTGDTSGVSNVMGTSIGNRFGPGAPVPLQPDGRFDFVGLAPGPYRVTVVVPPAVGRWWFRSARVGAVDVLDTPLELTPGVDVENVVLTFTDRRTELTGTLQTAGGLPAPEYFVIAMPADPAMRTERSRRVQSTRPATDGRFTFVELPPGDYLLVAMTDVEPDEWQQPEFLNGIASAGVRVTINEGARTEQDLRIRVPSVLWVP